MISRVLENLGSVNFDVVLLARRSHLDSQPEMFAALAAQSGIKIVPVDQHTEGSVCTILLGRSEIDRDAPLLIANCDQIVDFDCAEFVNDCVERKLDGSILVFREPGKNPKWSYAKINDQQIVTEVREKVAISDLATVGIYFFAKASYFFDAATDMIAHNDRVNGEFYTCPVYNYMIAEGLRVGVYEIASSAMHGIGTPEDLDAYYNRPEGRTAGWKSFVWMTWSRAGSSEISRPPPCARRRPKLPSSPTRQAIAKIGTCTRSPWRSRWC